MVEIKPDKSIDIKGFICPMTFVRSKLALEGMATGDVLEIILDYEEAFRSVPKSMEEQGHTVLVVDKINETDWRIMVKKG